MTALGRQLPKSIHQHRLTFFILPEAGIEDVLIHNAKLSGVMSGASA
jgi:hypothetical protein